MAAAEEDTSERLRGLSGSARRLLDYAVVLEGSARYEVLRHIARVSEEDIIEDLREVGEAGLLAAVRGRPHPTAFAPRGVRPRSCGPQTCSCPATPAARARGVSRRPPTSALWRRRFRPPSKPGA